MNDQCAKKTETNIKCYRRWRETFHDLEDVHVCNNGISSIHGKELTWTIVIPSRIQKTSHWKQLFDIPFHRKLKQIFFLILGELIFFCSYSFWRRSNYFLSSWRVTVFDPGGINIFWFMHFSPLCEIHQKATDAPITWSWHSDVVTRKNSTQVSVPWQVLNCHHEPLTQGDGLNPNHDGSS